MGKLSDLGQFAGTDIKHHPRYGETGLCWYCFGDAEDPKHFLPKEHQDQFERTIQILVDQAEMKRPWRSSNAPATRRTSPTTGTPSSLRDTPLAIASTATESIPA